MFGDRTFEDRMFGDRMFGDSGEIVIRCNNLAVASRLPFRKTTVAQSQWAKAPSDFDRLDLRPLKKSFESPTVVAMVAM